MAEPRNHHDPSRCALWLSPDPRDGCSCGGRTPSRSVDLSARYTLEQAWPQLSPVPQNGHRR